MDNVSIVVDDLAAATAFFIELGLELDGETAVEGRWVDRVVGLDDVRADIAIVRTPDGHGRLELTKFHAPAAISAEPNAPANTLGIRRIMFAVDDIEDVLARLRRMGPNSLARWSNSRTATCSVTSVGPRASWLRWPSSSTETLEGSSRPRRPPRTWAPTSQAGGEWGVEGVSSRCPVSIRYVPRRDLTRVRTVGLASRRPGRATRARRGRAAWRRSSSMCAAAKASICGPIMAVPARRGRRGRRESARAHRRAARVLPSDRPRR